MYDPRETDLSEEYAMRLFRASPGLVMLGGWAVHLLVRDGYRSATGREYLKSRDIDIFIPRSEASRARTALVELGMEPAAFRFRYSLQLRREDGRPLDRETASRMLLHEIVSIDVDVFADGSYWKGAWRIPAKVSKGILAGSVGRLGGARFKVPDPATLLGMKCEAYGNRVSEEKRVKDACDIYALLRFSEPGRSRASEAALARMLETPHPRFVARHLFADEGLEGLVRRDLRRWSTDSSPQRGRGAG